MRSSVICDKWVWLKLSEFLLCVSCVVCKRVTDDETTRVHLILQRISREWSLLRNVTWGRVGAALGDATYGGYTIITAGLLIARITREMPQGKRITEFFLLGLGAVLFVLLACLELFGVDDLPDNLIDNAIVLGTLSMLTALLFLIDLAGPKKISKKAYSQTSQQTSPPPAMVQSKPISRPQESPLKETTRPPPLETTFPATIETELITDWEPYKPTNIRRVLPKSSRSSQTQTIPNGTLRRTESIPKDATITSDTISLNNQIDTIIKPPDTIPEPPAWMKSQPPRSPLKVDTRELHSPLWSRLRSPITPKTELSPSPIKKSQSTSFLLPMPSLSEHFSDKIDNNSLETAKSSPIDPGYVQYAAEKWGQNKDTPKTPRHSPTEV